MLCVTHSATAIHVTMDDDEAAPECLSSLLSSSTSNTRTNPSSSSSGLGRAIDRHNPIIRDGRRIGTASSTSKTNNTSLLIPTPSSTRASSSSSSSTAAPNTTATTHKINHMINTKSVTDASEFSEVLANNGKNKKKKKNWQNTDNISTMTSVHSGGGGSSGGGAAVINKKKQISSQGGGWGCKNPGDFISPPIFSSSRYLLSSHEDAAILSYDPIIASEPGATASKSRLQLPAANFNKLEEYQFPPSLAPTSYIPVKPPPPSSPSDPSQHQQVVVLKVSLHCRGCERKMRKHISRMEGVTSFNIDFAAKKVMVVGDVTPLAVLASVSKVKNAQLLNPTISSSSSPPTVAKASKYSETVKHQGILVRDSELETTGCGFSRASSSSS